MTAFPERTYVTDDRDLSTYTESAMCLKLLSGENGDWYLSVLPEGERYTRHCVRITTSGSRHPHLPNAVHALWKALGEELGRKGPPDPKARYAETVTGAPALCCERCARPWRDLAWDGAYYCCTDRKECAASMGPSSGPDRSVAPAPLTGDGVSPSVSDGSGMGLYFRLTPNSIKVVAHRQIVTLQREQRDVGPTRTDRCTDVLERYLRIWTSIAEKGGGDLTREEEKAVCQAYLSGPFQDDWEFDGPLTREALAPDWPASVLRREIP